MNSTYLTNLFDSVSVNLSDLLAMEDKSYKAIYPLTQPLNMSSREIVSPFYPASMSKPDMMGDYNISPEYVTILSNYRYRYLLVWTGTEHILVTLKVVDPPCVQRYFVITYTPMALDGLRIDFLKTLSQFPCFKAIEPISRMSHYTRNTYYNLLEDYKHISKSKWRSSHGVNKLSNLITVRSDLDGDESLFCRYLELFEIWCNQTGKIIKGDSDWRYYVKSDRNTMEIASKSGFILTFWFKDKLIGLTMGIPYLLDDCVIIPTQRSIGVGSIEFIQEYLDIDESIASDLKKYLGSFVQYHIHKHCFDDLKKRVLFYGGDMDDKNMKYFKELYYKHSINYTRMLLTEYLEGDVSDA